MKIKENMENVKELENVINKLKLQLDKLNKSNGK